MENQFLNHLKEKKLKSEIPVIAEIKPKTPEGLDLLRGRKIPCLVREYEQGGAACISIVTGKWYGGNPEMLAELAECTKLPILRKDMITNKKQIDQSKSLGASAILLTQKLLNGRHMNHLINHALQTGLVPFIEVADEKEFKKVHAVSGVILAVNNRNISVKEMDNGDYQNSLNLIRHRLKNKNVLYVSASSLNNRSEINHLLASGYDGFLIGTALLQAKNAKNKLRELIAA